MGTRAPEVAGLQGPGLWRPHASSPLPLCSSAQVRPPSPGASQVLGAQPPGRPAAPESCRECIVELSFFWQTLETDKNTHVKTFLGQNL